MTAKLPPWVDPRPWLAAAENAGAADVARALAAEAPDAGDLAVLLSPAAAPHVEAMARRAEALTRARFGRTINLYAPLYVSDYCSSGCVYCGFASDRERPRRRLEPDALREELAALKRRGFEEVLLLTGERTPQAGYAYLRACVALAAESFPSVAVETFPMRTEEYRGLAAAGCTAVTLYQETYDPERYEALHRWGPKRDYAGRLDAPARALGAGIRTVGLGVLLGLGDPLFDAVALFRHAQRLGRAYWRGGLAISFPRVRPQPGGFVPPAPVDDVRLAQMIFAFRIVLPDVPLVLSTREAPAFRDGIVGIGICKMSVDSRTTVGGYHEPAQADDGQFDVCDTRDVPAFCAMLRRKRLEPVFKHWDAAYR